VCWCLRPSHHHYLHDGWWGCPLVLVGRRRCTSTRTA
jgi:hypothetical protein